LDRDGRLVTVTMGSYGIGVTRILAAIAETTHDDKGLCWPRAVAPFDVQVVLAGKDEAMVTAAESLATDIADRGIEVLVDVRGERPGVKFADAELLGVPTVVIVGKSIADGEVELWDRRSGDRTRLAVADAAATIAGLLAE